MSDFIKHECGIAMLRLKKPLAYYHDKYGSALYGFQKLFPTARHFEEVLAVVPDPEPRFLDLVKHQEPVDRLLGAGIEVRDLRHLGEPVDQTGASGLQTRERRDSQKRGDSGIS